MNARGVARTGVNRNGDRLLYRDFVGPGLSQGALDALRTAAQPLARPTSPFADLLRRKETMWLEPVLEAEVSYGRIVGGKLREPGLRRFVTEPTPTRSPPRPSCERGFGPPLNAHETASRGAISAAHYPAFSKVPEARTVPEPPVAQPRGFRYHRRAGEAGSPRRHQPEGGSYDDHSLGRDAPARPAAQPCRSALPLSLATSAAAQPLSGPEFIPLTPCRALDTRVTGTPVPANVPTTIQISGVTSGGTNCGVPSTAVAAALNFTITQPQGPGWMAAWAGGPLPLASVVNFVAGETVANAVDIGLGAGGTVLVQPVVTTHLVVDIYGYFTDVEELGRNNTALGVGALINNTTGSVNTALGAPGPPQQHHGLREHGAGGHRPL
jgi:ATP dependent DNA ligase C terminal region